MTGSPVLRTAGRSHSPDNQSEESYVPPLPPKMEKMEPYYHRVQYGDGIYDHYDSGYSSNPSSEEILDLHSISGDNVLRPRVYSPYMHPHDSPMREFYWSSFQRNSFDQDHYDVPIHPNLDYDIPTRTNLDYDVPGRHFSLYDRPTMKIAQRKEVPLLDPPQPDVVPPPLPPRKHRPINTRDFEYVEDDVFVIGSHTISRQPIFRNPPCLYFPDPPAYPPPTPSSTYSTPMKELSTPIRDLYETYSTPRRDPPPYKPKEGTIGFRNPAFVIDDDHPSAFKAIDPDKGKQNPNRTTSSVFIPHQRESLV